MELSLSIQPGDTAAANPVGIPDPQIAVRLGRLGGVGSLTVLGAPFDLRRFGDALLQAAAANEE
jgi:hypothetical protein